MSEKKQTACNVVTYPKPRGTRPSPVRIQKMGSGETIKARVARYSRENRAYGGRGGAA